MVRFKTGLVAVALLLAITLGPKAQEKKLTKEDVYQIEAVAGRLRGRTYRRTRTNLVIGADYSPFNFLEIYETSPPNSNHYFQVNLLNGQLTMSDFYSVGSKNYKKTADGPWVVSEIKTVFPVEPVENPSKASDDPAHKRDFAKLLDVFAAEDELIARNDPHAKRRAVITRPEPPADLIENVEVKYEPDKILGKTVINYYEVVRRGATGSGKTLIEYTMIKRVWVNKNGTLARTEFEYRNNLRPTTQLMTDVYEYDSNIKIEAPIK